MYNEKKEKKNGMNTISSTKFPPLSQLSPLSGFFPLSLSRLSLMLSVLSHSPVPPPLSCSSLTLSILTLLALSSACLLLLSLLTPSSLCLPLALTLVSHFLELHPSPSRQNPASPSPPPQSLSFSQFSFLSPSKPNAQLRPAGTIVTPGLATPPVPLTSLSAPTPANLVTSCRPQLCPAQPNAEPHPSPMCGPVPGTPPDSSPTPPCQEPGHPSQLHPAAPSSVSLPSTATQPPQMSSSALPSLPRSHHLTLLRPHPTNVPTNPATSTPLRPPSILVPASPISPPLVRSLPRPPR